MKPKLIYIITRSEIGGAQNHVLSLIDYFSHSFEIVLITGSKGYLLDRVDSLDVKPKIHIIKSVDSFNLISSVAKLIRVFQSEQPYLIHSHSALASLSARFAAFFCRKKLIYTVHGWHFANKTAFKKKVQIGIEYLCKRLTGYWITVSEYDRDLGECYNLFNNNKVSVIRNGIGDVSHSLREPRAKGVEPDVFRLVFVGRMSQQKNFLVPLDVLFESRKNVCLTMYLAGSEADAEVVKSKLKSLSLSKRCKVVLNDLNPSQYLAGYDAMIITSRYEGMPLSIIEGLRAGLPIIGFNVCGMRELVNQNNGCLVPFNDIRGLVDSVEKMLQDGEMVRSMRRSSRLMYEKQFTESKMLLSVEQVYKKVLNE